jgi:hypothetical protein
MEWLVSPFFYSIHPPEVVSCHRFKIAGLREGGVMPSKVTAELS